MGNISARGWYVLAAVPFASMAVAFALLFVDPFAAGVVVAVGMLVVTPVLAVVLWMQGESANISETDGGTGGSS